jgi:tetratricopeptide (TPR) repeat protein
LSSDDGETPQRARRRGSGPPAWARRTLLGVVVASLVGANAYVIRKQFPPVERRKNEAYDAGLRALDLDSDPDRFVRAEMEFRRYLELDPRHRRVRYLLGVALQAQAGEAKLDEARAEYGRVLVEDPDFDEARVALAEMAQAAQSFEEAFRQLDLARERDPTPTAVFMLRARLLAATGDQDGAVVAFKETLRRDPDSYESSMALGDLLMARSMLGGSSADRQDAAGNYKNAEEVLRRRLANTENRRLRVLLARSIYGQARVLQKRQLGEAVTELRRAAEADPDDIEPTLILAEFFRTAGNYDEALRILEDARRKWTQPADASRVLVKLHELYGDQGRPDESLAALREAVSRSIDDPALRVRLVGHLASLGRFDEAEKEADAAQQLFPQDENVHAARGDLARARSRRGGSAEEVAKRRAEALDAYRRALALRPHSIRLKKLVAGELIEGMTAKPAGAPPSEDERLALRCIEDVLRVNARDAEALGWRARLLLVEGKYDDVVASLRLLIDASAPPIEALRVLGTAAALVAEHRLAADAFARVVSMQRDPAREAGPEAVGTGPSALDWFNAARAARDAGRLDVAVELGLVGARLRADSVDVRRELGAAQLAKGDAASAVRTLSAAKTEFDKDAGVRVLLARAYEASGRIDVAEEELKNAVVDLPTEATRMAYFEFLARTGRAAAAEQGFLSMTASDPDSPGGWLILGDYYLSLKPPRTQAALEQYKKALELTRGGAAPLLRIAELHLGLAKRDPAAFTDAQAAVDAFVAAAPLDPWADYLRGKLALAGGRPADAAPLLSKFTAKVPTSAEGAYYLGRALRDLGRYDEAIASMERAARIAKSDATIAVELAMLQQDAGTKAMERGDYAAAQRLFTAAEAGGAGRGARVLLSAAHFDAGAIEPAERELRKILEEEPDNLFALQVLAMTLIRKGTREVLDEVEALYRRVLELKPDDFTAKLGVALTRYERGDFTSALGSLRALYPKTDGSPIIAMAIAQCMAALNDASGAAAFLDAEIQAHPKSDALHHLKGDFLVHLKQPLDAVREFRIAYDMNPDNVGALLAAAAALMQGRDHEGARKLLVEKLPSSKTPGPVRLALGEALLYLGRLEEGGDELRRSLQDAPGHPRALYLLGRLAEMKGQKAEAKQLYGEATRRGSIDADAYARLAHIASEDGDRAAAIEAYTTAARIEPRNVVVRNNRALLLAEEEGRMDEALADARTAHALAPERPEFADTYGWLLFRTGRAKEAAPILQGAADRLSTNAVVQYHAGMALSRVSRAIDAREHLARALRIDPKFEGADAARAELEKLR